MISSFKRDTVSLQFNRISHFDRHNLTTFTLPWCAHQLQVFIIMVAHENADSFFSFFFFFKVFLEDQRHFDGSSSSLWVKVWFTRLQSEGVRLAAAVIGVKAVRKTGISEFETNILLIEMMY